MRLLWMLKINAQEAAARSSSVIPRRMLVGVSCFIGLVCDIMRSRRADSMLFTWFLRKAIPVIVIAELAHNL
jgi:hypothetical protein